MVIKINSLAIHKLAERTFIENLKPFLFFAGLFMVLSLLVEVIFGPEADGFVVNVIEYVLYAKLAVLVHRSVLLNEKDIIHAFKWGFPEVIYMLAMIAVAIAIAAFISVITMLLLMISPSGSVPISNPEIISVVFFVLIFGILAYFGARLALAFPSIAIGQSFTLNELWNKTKPHTLTVFWLIIIFPILAQLVPAVIYFLPLPEWLLIALVLVMYAVIVIYCITLMSHCYQEIMGEPDSDQDLPQ